MGVAKRNVRIEDSIAYSIHRTARLLRVHLLQKMRAAGYDITPEQWFVLSKLVDSEGKSQSELCEEIFSERPNMTRIIAGIEKAGLVRRTVDPEDRRRNIVVLTAKGSKAASELSVMALATRQRVFRGLNKDDVAATRRLLERLEDNVLNDMDS